MPLRYRVIAFGLLFWVGVPAGAGAAAPDSAPDGAERLYKLKCAKCHKLYDPKGYDDAAWDRWMGKMKRKARLTDEQYEAVWRYTDKIRKGEV